MTFKEAVSVPAQSAGRALGSVLNKVKQCSDLRFCTCIQIYNSCVCPVSDCASSRLGFREHIHTYKLHHWLVFWVNLFWGVHKLTSVLAISGDMGRKPQQIRHNCQMLHLKGHLIGTFCMVIPWLMSWNPYFIWSMYQSFSRTGYFVIFMVIRNKM